MISTYALLGIICFVINYFISKKGNFFEKFNQDYNPVQKIHSGYVPKIGGLVVITIFYIGLILLNDQSIFLRIDFLLCAILFISISIFEDIFGKSPPILRLLSIFIASLIAIYNQDALPVIDIPIIDKFLIDYPIINILFFSIGLTALANGFNIIDGMNGLLGLTSLGCIAALFTLTYFITNDYLFQTELKLLTLGISIFLFFNFPLGKVFFGDTGCYWVGWIIGLIVIKIYSSSSINTWGAILIIFYPLQEVIFSFIRKTIQKKSPLSSDVGHLHLKLYFILKGTSKRGIKFNSFVTVCLMPFWFIPSTMVLWSQLHSNLSIFFIIILEIIYLVYYFSIPVLVRD